MTGGALLEVRDLQTCFETAGGLVPAVDGVSFQVAPGEALGLVGESGSGKTLTCLSLLRLLPAGTRITRGQVLFEGRDLLTASPAAMRAVRGARISMILQDSLTSLNPAFTIGSQVGEAFRLGWAGRGRVLRDRVVAALRRVRLPDAAGHLRDYPHALSGGMRQRVAGAIALARSPALLIADEPTTALDVTVQAQYLQLLQDVQRESGMSLIVVTHDFGVVARLCDRVAVMYAGRVVETGPTGEIFRSPRHPYTRALLGCLPRLDGPVLDLVSIEGQPPVLGRAGPGCRFAPRCAMAVDRCREDPPELAAGPRHRVSCWRADETAPGAGPPA